MKKSERINDMILFLNNKNSFNLKDLMERYQISKSTALRDIQSLEAIGIPIFSELGRNGKYGILDTKIFASMMFTVDEIYALYFSLLTLNGYKSKPFTIESSTLEMKFRNVLPEQLQKNILLMNQIVSLETINHSNFSPYLKEIMTGIIQEKVFKFFYLKEDEELLIIAQFIQVYSKFGQWYARVWNVESQKVRIIRCDKIKSLSEETNHEALSIDYLLSKTENFHREELATRFMITVDEKGKDIFDKEHYPSMSIKPNKKNYVITGYYNKNEASFISNYLLKFGQSIIQIHPSNLKKSVLTSLRTLYSYIDKL